MRNYTLAGYDADSGQLRYRLPVLAPFVQAARRAAGLPSEVGSLELSWPVTPEGAQAIGHVIATRVPSGAPLRFFLEPS